MLYILLIAYIIVIYANKDELNRKLSTGPYTIGAHKNNAELLTIHVISHTHDDPGWIRTTDEYYVKQVRYILNTVVQSLEANPERKFTFVEQKFFQLWWAEQSEDVRAKIRKFVSNGQFEFNLGGWIMHDEASPEYESMIMNMALGAQFIKEQFGIRPTVAWHVDPFGHSQQNARLIAEMGFDAFAINRIDYRTKDQWKKTKEMEFVWRTSTSLGNETDVFVHTMSNHYCPPAEVDLGIWVQKVSSKNSEWPNDATNNTEIESFPNNMKEYADRLADVFRSRQLYWDNGNHQLLPFGCDFTFTNAELNFLQMDQLMKYYRQHFSEYNIKIQYSHFSDYIKALHNENREWKLYSGDLMPYPDEVASWTGYYTSRPRFKGNVRIAHNLLRTVDLFDTMMTTSTHKIDKESLKTKLRLRKIVSETLHHDAITGTEKQYVADDYLRRLEIASEYSRQLASKIVVQFTKNSYSFSMNSTSILTKLKQGVDIAVVLYNNIGWNRNEILTIVSPISNVIVVDKDSNIIASQITPIPSFSLDKLNGSYYLYINVSIPALGHNTIFLRYSNNVHVSQLSLDNVIENSIYSIEVDKTTGELLNYKNKITSKITKLNNNIYHYVGEKYSGAYVFRPAGEATIITNKIKEYIKYSGELIDECYISYKDGYVLLVRIYKFGDKLNTFEMNYHLGPLDSGRELVTRFKTNIINDGIYTDANGLETLKRNNLDTEYPISGNYFPQTSRIYIENTNKDNRLTIITDRAHGVASLKSGELEIMLHRRCLNDDGYGVEEPLTENDQVNIKLWGFIDTSINSIDYMRKIDILLNHQIHMFYTDITSTYNGVISSSLLKSELPYNLHIISFIIPSDTLVYHLRLHHIYESSDNTDLSKPININLNDLFKDITIKSVKELILNGNELLSTIQANRLQWKIKGGDKTGVKRSTLNGILVNLRPMDIGTYEIEYN